MMWYCLQLHQHRLHLLCRLVLFPSFYIIGEALLPISVCLIWAKVTIFGLDAILHCSIPICSLFRRAMAWQPNICKIVLSSLYSWTININETKKNMVLTPYVKAALPQGGTWDSISSFSIQPFYITAFLATAVYIFSNHALILAIHQLFLLDWLCLYLLVCI